MNDAMPDDIWRVSHRYQKEYVKPSDIFIQGVAQPNMFDENAPRANSEALMSLMYKLDQQGRRTLYFCGTGYPAVAADEAGNAVAVLHDTACRCAGCTSQSGKRLCRFCVVNVS